MGNYDAKHPNIYPEKDGTRAKARANKARTSDENIANCVGKFSKYGDFEKNSKGQFTDKMFVKIPVFYDDKTSLIDVVPETFHEEIVDIMCPMVGDIKNVVRTMLKVPYCAKMIQYLENEGIKKDCFSKFFYSCCDEDTEIFDITLFMFKNNFFNIDEILDNLNHDEAIPFYNPNVVIDIDEENLNSGFSVKLKSKIALIPSKIRSGDTDVMINFVEERFNRLKAAVREDYFKRLQRSENENTKLLDLRPKED